MRDVVIIDLSDLYSCQIFFVDKYWQKSEIMASQHYLI